MVFRRTSGFGCRIEGPPEDRGSGTERYVSSSREFLDMASPVESSFSIEGLPRLSTFRMILSLPRGSS